TRTGDRSTFRPAPTVWLTDVGNGAPGPAARTSSATGAGSDVATGPAVGVSRTTGGAARLAATRGTLTVGRGRARSGRAGAVGSRSPVRRCTTVLGIGRRPCAERTHRAQLPVLPAYRRVNVLGGDHATVVDGEQGRVQHRVADLP